MDLGHADGWRKAVDNASSYERTRLEVAVAKREVAIAELQSYSTVKVFRNKFNNTIFCIVMLLLQTTWSTTMV